MLGHLTGEIAPETLMQYGYVKHPVLTRNHYMRFCHLKAMYQWLAPDTLRELQLTWPRQARLAQGHPPPAAQRVPLSPQLPERSEADPSIPPEDVDWLPPLAEIIELETLSPSSSMDELCYDVGRECDETFPSNARPSPASSEATEATVQLTADAEGGACGDGSAALAPRWTLADVQRLDPAKRIFGVRSPDGRNSIHCKWQVIVRSNRAGVKPGKSMGWGATWEEAEQRALQLEVDFKNGDIPQAQLLRSSRASNAADASTPSATRVRSRHPAATGSSKRARSPGSAAPQQKRRKTARKKAPEAPARDALALHPLPALILSDGVLRPVGSNASRFVPMLCGNELDRVRARLRIDALRDVVQRDVPVVVAQTPANTAGAESSSSLATPMPLTVAPASPTSTAAAQPPPLRESHATAVAQATHNQRRRWLAQAKRQFDQIEATLTCFRELRRRWAHAPHTVKAWMEEHTLEIADDGLPRSLTQCELPLDAVCAEYVDDASPTHTRLLDATNEREVATVCAILGELYESGMPYTQEDLCDPTLYVVVVSCSGGAADPPCGSVKGVMIVDVFTTSSRTHFAYVKSLVVTEDERAGSRRPRHGRKLLACAHRLALARAGGSDGLGFVVAQCTFTIPTGNAFWRRTAMTSDWRAGWIGAQLLHSATGWPCLTTCGEGWPIAVDEGWLVERLDPSCEWRIAPATRDAPVCEARIGRGAAAGPSSRGGV